MDFNQTYESKYKFSHISLIYYVVHIVQI
jgi:hypothetical protein